MRLEPDLSVLAVAAAAARERVAWAALVGGWVRERSMDEASADLDLVVPEGGARVASRIADSIGGTVVPLSRWRQWLVFSPRLRVDVSEADDLEGDLLRRDLTVNAMAWYVLPERRRLEAVVDPLDGIGDLEAGRLAPCSPGSMSSDPSRIIRAARLIADGFTPGEALLVAARQASDRLVEVSLDRVRRDWRRLASARLPWAGVRFLSACGALKGWLGMDLLPQPLAAADVLTAAETIGVRLGDEASSVVALALGVLGQVAGSGREAFVEAASRLGLDSREASLAWRLAASRAGSS